MATRIDTSNKLLASRIPHDELTIRMDSGSCQLCPSSLHRPSPPPHPSMPGLLAARGCLPSGLGPGLALVLVWPFPEWDSVALVECFWALRTVYPPLAPSLSTPLCLTFACRFSFMMMLLLFVFDQFVFFAIVVYFPSFMHFNLLANLSPARSFLSSLPSLPFLARHPCHVSIATLPLCAQELKFQFSLFICTTRKLPKEKVTKSIVSKCVGKRKYT